MVARLNPLTDQVDALRGLMVEGSATTFSLWVDFAVLAGTLVGLIAIAGRLYPRLAE